VEQEEVTVPEGDVSYDFFKRKAFLTVSGQLEGEDGATGLGRVYTFGPTFRREHSKTRSHLAEFWMVEPEFAGWWVDKYYLMTIVEKCVQFTLQSVLKECTPDLEFLEQYFASESPDSSAPSIVPLKESVIEALTRYATEAFIRVSYTDAIRILEDAVATKGAEFEFPVSWGIDLAKEHERYLTDVHFKRPTFVFDFPTEIKSFYMKKTDETGKTVGAFDLLVPGVGELVGGSERESDLEKLKTEMEKRGMDLAPYDTYLDLRKYGTVPHGGFGIGFERLILFITGAPSIRDCIPYPRYFER
jgi:asparaginyl-tRNA synthetase